MKIRTKISLFILLSGLFLITSGIVSFYYIFSFFHQKDTFNKLLTWAESRSYYIETILQSNTRFILEFTTNSSVQRDLKALLSGTQTQRAVALNLNNYLAQYRQMAGVDIYHILVIDPEGKLVASTNEKYSFGDDFATASFFIQGKKALYRNEVLYEATLKKNVIMTAAPIYEQGVFLGVAAVQVGFDSIERLLSQSTPTAETTQFYIVDDTGANLSPIKDVPSNKSPPLANKTVKTCLNDQTQYRIERGITRRHKEELTIAPDYRGVMVWGVHRHMNDAPWCLIVEIEEWLATSIVRQLSVLFLGFSALGTVAVFLLSHLLGATIALPLENLLRAIQAFEKGDEDYPLNTAAEDEIGFLAKNFKHMVSVIKENRANIKKEVEKQVAQRKLLENQQRATLNVLEDVEQEKNRSVTLAQDLEKFRLAVEGASDQVVITDSEGTVLYANKATETITGFSKKEVIGKKSGSLWGGLMEEYFYQKLWRKVKKEKKPFSGEVVNHRKSGERYIAEMHISPILNAARNVLFFVAIERDITKEKEIDKMKTEFISLASHQLRTPLGVMKWFLEMLLHGDAGKLSVEQEKFLHNIDQSNERMIGLVNALLNISRIESGRIIIDPKPIDLPALVRSVMKEIKVTFSKKRINLDLKTEGTMPTLNIDSRLTENIFLNIIGNAMKYTPKNGSVTIHLKKNKYYMVCEVADTGMGIPQSAQKNIFHKFFRGSNVAKKYPEGSGLGLYITRALVEAMNGEMGFRSTEGKGSVFWFKLPLEGVRPKKGEVRLAPTIVKS